MANYPPFGAQAGFASTSVTRNADVVEYIEGMNVYTFIRSVSNECVAERSSCEWGIASPVIVKGNQVIVESAEFIITDNIDDDYIAINPGETPNQSEPLVELGCCRILNATVSYTVTVKGEVDMAIGSTDHIIVTSAIGTFDTSKLISEVLKDETNEFKLMRNSTQSTESDWTKTTLEWRVKMKSTGKSLALYFADFDPIACPGFANNCYSYEARVSFNATGYLRKTLITRVHQVKAR